MKICDLYQKRLGSTNEEEIVIWGLEQMWLEWDIILIYNSYYTLLSFTKSSPKVRKNIIENKNILNKRREMGFYFLYC